MREHGACRQMEAQELAAQQEVGDERRMASVILKRT